MAGTIHQDPRAAVPVATTGGGVQYVSATEETVPSSYATMADLFALSIPEDSAHDFTTAALRAHLVVGASRINEHLGQRFQTPLRLWSPTVVWANCELAAIGAFRQRGVNTESAVDLRSREAAVISWLKSARDHEITPDQRLTAIDDKVACRYISDDARGWDGPPAGFPTSRRRRY